MTAFPEIGPGQSPADDGSGLEAVAPAYKNVLRLRLAATWIPLTIGALILDGALNDTPFYGLPSVLVPLLALISIVLVPQRVHRYLRFRLSDTLLQVVRGWMFHVDTVVPLVRVQHIDVARGPIEKLFGTATLLVHTAGTHNSIVSLPGLLPERAEQIRDAIRERIRTDFE